MLVALNSNGKKVLASKGASGFCPHCKGEVIAKCGDINVDHWAHKVNTSQCTYGGETDWHLGWKSLFPVDLVEVPYKKYGITKIADAVLKNGTVVEFQHSSISSREIRLREAFYGKMIWVFDASEYKENIKLTHHDEYCTFRWLWPKKSIWHCKKPLYLDFGDFFMFSIKKIYPNVPCAGWGVMSTRLAFKEWISVNI